MTASNDIQNMALFCDFENVALGVQEANYPRFDIDKVLERLLVKGNIVVKKAYCDWDRYKEFKKAMHEAAFELIEIPHVRQSGKNSADIRMVVDALDLCYTKSHVDAFVIISGDSDFSPLVAKLRENNKVVIGVGVRKSTSDLLTGACDEFIFYDELVKQQERRKRRTPKKEDKPAASDKPAAAGRQGGEDAQRQQEGVQLFIATVEALVNERGGDSKLWASMVKQALKRRRPDFSESAFGFSSFGELLDAAHRTGAVSVERDEKSGNYLVRLLHADE